LSEKIQNLGHLKTPRWAGVQDGGSLGLLSTLEKRESIFQLELFETEGRERPVVYFKRKQITLSAHVMNGWRLHICIDRCFLITIFSWFMLMVWLILGSALDLSTRCCFQRRRKYIAEPTGFTDQKQASLAVWRVVAELLLSLKVFLINKSELFVSKRD
jgi:hypothetical protein